MNSKNENCFKNVLDQVGKGFVEKSFIWINILKYEIN